MDKEEQWYYMTTKLFYCKICNKGTFEPMNMFKIMSCKSNIEDVKWQGF